MSSRIRIAVIGSGHLGRYHARLAAANDDYELIAVVDPVVEARQQLADELGVRSVEHHQALTGHIDAAVIATPTRHHHQVSLELLLAGIHLLVEKPLTAELRQADELVDAAAANRCTLQVGHVERFNPALNAVREKIRHPKYIETQRFSGYAFRSTDIGVVLDLMVHDIDVILDLVGARPVRVEALGACVVGPHEDVANARITFDNGCVANLNASRISYEPMRRMHVWCPHAFVAVDYANGTAKIACLGDAMLTGQFQPDALSPIEKQQASQQFFEEYLPVEEVATKPRNAIADELSDFAVAIRSGRPPRVPGSAGRDALAVCEQILDGIQHHAWDAHAAGRIGPEATVAVPTIPVPPAQLDTPRRRAG